MIRPAELAAIRAGEIDLAFRRWERPRVRVGTRMRTGVGLIEVTSLERVGVREITADDARRAGAATRTALLTALEGRPGAIHRIGLAYAGADPREALRDQIPDDAELATLRAWLDRLDAAAPYGPWTREALALIGRHPGRRAPELAAEAGRETAEFKRDVRKLKERGLTQSLDIGYRLSPRGAAVLGDGTAAAVRPDGGDLPKVGAPASRALSAAGVTSLADLGTRREAEIAALHGVGPFALTRLREALAAAGLTYAADDADDPDDPDDAG